MPEFPAPKLVYTVFIHRTKTYILSGFVFFSQAHSVFAQRSKDSTTVTVTQNNHAGSATFSVRTPNTVVGYTPDEGFKAGLGLTISTGKPSHRLLTGISATHAFSTRAWRFNIYNEWHSVLGSSTDLITDLDIRIPNNTTYFYGYGMRSVYDKNASEGFRYYRARYDRADLSLSLRHRFSSKLALRTGIYYEYYEMDASNKLNARRFIAQTGTGPGKNGLTAAGIFNLQKYFGTFISLHADTRKNTLLPERGVLWHTSIQHLYQLKTSRYNPTILNTDLSVYFPVVPGHLTFINSMGVGATLGRFSFQHAQYLGNAENLRGFRNERWAGSTKWYNQATLRWKLSDVQSHLLTGPLGFNFFTDTGRVWTPGEAGNHLAVGYGGGLWISPMNRLLVTFNYAFSKEDQLPSVMMEWRL